MAIEEDEGRERIAAHDTRRHFSLLITDILRDLYVYHMNGDNDKFLASIRYLARMVRWAFTDKEREGMNAIEEAVSEVYRRHANLPNSGKYLERKYLRLQDQRLDYMDSLMTAMSDHKMLLPFYEDEDDDEIGDDQLFAGGGIR